jgi:hypothetical protein
MPSFWQIGSRMGTRIVIAAVGSRKQPTNSISRLASSRKTQASLVKPSTHCAMAAVTPVAVSIQPKIDAAATMNITVAVVSTVSRQTLTNIFQLQRAVPDQAQEHGPGAGGDGAFGGREQAGGHAADQQHRRHDGQHRLELEEAVGKQHHQRRQSR